MSLPYAKKSLGQHWLEDRPTLQAICDAAKLTATDTVLEIGPGPGSLTALLVERVNRVVAVEFDSNLAHELPARIPAKNLEVVHQDILRFDFSSMPVNFKLVANIPYYLTSNLIRVISETSNPPSIAVLLIQKEVAERLAAAPGDMSLLSVTAQYYWDVRKDIIVPAKLFIPPPKVDSQVVVMVRRDKPIFSDEIDTKLFFRIVKAGFSARRKTLLNSLSGGLRIDKNAINKLLVAAGIEPTRRAQTMSLYEWHAVYKSINELEFKAK